MICNLDIKLFRKNTVGFEAFFDLWDLPHCFNDSAKPTFVITSEVTANSIVVPGSFSDEESFFNVFSKITEKEFSIFARPAILSSKGEIVGAITKSGQSYAIEYDKALNCLFLPFNPFAAIENFLLEKYLNKKKLTFSPLQSFAYRFLPAGFKDQFSRLFFKVNLRRSRKLFPKWPLDNSLIYLYDFILGCIKYVTGTCPERRKIWSGDYEGALLLTHDLDTSRDWRNLSKTLQIENEFGYTSDWFVVPASSQYNINNEDLRKKLELLVSSGRNLNIHDYRHDGRLFKYLNNLKPEDLKPAFLSGRDKISGFRSQHLFRDPTLLDFLTDEFNYDSSYIDNECDSLYAKSSGCLSYFPFFYQEILEIPLTLPQDYTLFKSFNMNTKEALELWIKKIEAILENNGLINILVHPSLVGNWYKDLLSYFRTKRLWNTTMLELSKWWRSNTPRSSVSYE